MNKNETNRDDSVGVIENLPSVTSTKPAISPIFNKDEFPKDQPDVQKEILRYLYVIQRRLRTLIATFLIVVLSTIIYTTYKTPVYEATTMLILEPDLPHVLKNQEPLTSSLTVMNYYQTQFDIIKSYTVAKKACEALGLLKEQSSEQKSDPVKAFMRMITVIPVRNSQLVNVSMRNSSAETAANYVNTLARAFIQHNLDDRKSASRDAFTWLSEQLTILRAKVEKSETALLKFKEKEDIVSLDKRQTLLEEKLSAVHDAYTKATTQSMELKTILEEIEKLQKKPDAVESLPRILENPVIQRLKEEYSKVNAELASVSKKYKSKHPKIITLQSQLDNLRNGLRDEINKISTSVEIDYRIKKSNEDSIKNNLDDLKHQSMTLAQQAIEYGVLKRDSDSNRQMYDVLLQRLKETDISGSITANNIRVVDEAKVPTAPIIPQKKRDIPIAAVVGLFLGAVLCFFLEYIDNTLKDEKDVKIYLREPFLGVVMLEKEKLFDWSNPPKILSRCYHEIKTTLSFYSEEHVLKSLLITSTIESEGKTTTSIMLAKSFAESGSKVLLIDADLYKGRIARLMEIKNNVGISDYFLNNKSPKEIITETTIKNFSLLPAGRIQKNPNEIIVSDKFKHLLETVKGDFDIVIIDAPPLSAAIEVSLLGASVDGVIMAIRSTNTSRHVAMKMVDRLRLAKGNIIGTILTFARPIHGDYGGYYYKYYYSGYYKSEAKPDAESPSETIELSDNKPKN